MADMCEIVCVIDFFKSLRRQFRQAIKSTNCSDELKEQSYKNGYEYGRTAPAKIQSEQLSFAGIISVLNDEYLQVTDIFETLDWCSFGLGFIDGILTTLEKLWENNNGHIQ